MLQCASAVVQSQEQPHLNTRLHTGGIKTEAETTATAASNKNRLEPSGSLNIRTKKKAAHSNMGRLESREHPLVHVASATVRHGGFFLLLWNLRNEGFGRQQESSYRCSVLQGSPGHLGRIDHAGGDQVFEVARL